MTAAAKFETYWHEQRMMGEQERHHAKLDFDKAEDAGTPEAKVAWFEKWGRRVADHLWSPA